MILIDANLLIYAYNRSSEQHDVARAWLERVLSGDELLGLAWQSVLAFLRITTHTRLFERPLQAREAVGHVDSWFERPGTRLLQPTERHWALLSQLLPDAQARGPLVMDAHLAVLAIEHGATLCTTDRDFSRFPGLRFVDPLVQA